jgi:hypothetical protein
VTHCDKVGFKCGPDHHTTRKIGLCIHRPVRFSAIEATKPYQPLELVIIKFELVHADLVSIFPYTERWSSAAAVGGPLERRVRAH